MKAVAHGEYAKELQRQNEKLKQDVETVYKSAVFWEREYNREKNKKWYHKLFGL